MKIIVRTPAGLHLTTAVVVAEHGGFGARLDEVPRSNGLLTYYFGKNGRKVTVEGETFAREAALSTRYGRGGRTWHLALTEALPAVEVVLDPERMTRFPAARPAETQAAAMPLAS